MLKRGMAFMLCVLALSQWGCGSKKVTEPDAETKRLDLKIQSGTWVGTVGDAQVTISLAQDGRFQTVFRGGNYRSIVKGTARLEETVVVLEAKELDGKPAKNPADLKPKKLSFDPEWQVLTTDDGLKLKRKI